MPDGVEWRTDVASQAFGESDMLVVEIANLGDPAIARTFTQLGTTPGQPPLSDRVEPEEREAVIALLQSAEADDDDFASTESWAAALSLASQARTGLPENGVDRALIAEARERGIGVYELEFFSEQLGLFDNLSEEAQSDMLYAVAKDAQAGTSDQLLEAWLSGDVDRMEQLSEASLLANTEIRNSLLVQRNRAWVQPIHELVDFGWKPFIAVGAAHLVGPDGIPALLEARGYTVTRIQ